MQSRLSTTKLPEFRRQCPLFEQERRQGPFFKQHSLFLSSKLSKQARPRVCGYCERFTRGRRGREHTPSTAFRHLPPNSARFGYATEGALFISPQLSTDAVSTLRKVWVLIKLQALVFGGRCQKAMLGVWVLQTPSIGLRHPSFNHCRIYLRHRYQKLSANEQFFVGAQTVVSLLQTTQIKQGVSFIPANKVYTSTNKTTIV